MKTRLTTPNDYKQLKKWWDFWWPNAPSKAMLPNNLKDGVMVFQDDQNICAGFIYRTPSNICFCEYIVSNPEVKDRKTRQEALYLLIETISHIAKQMGFKYIYTFTDHQNLIKKYEDCGYQKGSQSFEMIKVL